jgi:hypothetical protein
MVVIFIAIDPVELQPLREFRSDADIAPLLRGELLYCISEQLGFRKVS